MIIRTAFLSSLLVIAAAAASAAFKWLPLPWLALFGAGAAVSVLAALKVNTFRMKAVLLNVAAIFVGLFAAEGFGMARELGPLRGDGCQTSRSDSIDKNREFSVADPLLGYGPNPNTTTHSALIRADGSHVYDAVYTVGSNALRSTRADLGSEHRVIAVFGCSFAFGVGVNDDETIASFLNQESSGRYRAVNFGFSGYGPHQMLRAIEGGRAEAILGKSVLGDALYLAIPAHVERSAGRYPYASWDTSGPAYEMTSSEELRHRGAFIESPIVRRVYAQLYKSYLFRSISEVMQQRRERDTRLFIKIVANAQREWTKRFGTDLIVVMWNGAGAADLAIQLRREGLTVIETSEIFGREQDAAMNWRLDRCDSHPSPAANLQVADYLVTHVLR